MAVDTHFWAWSNFNIFANFYSLRTNNGALESFHQGEFVFSIAQGAGTITKNNYLLRANRQYIICFSRSIALCLPCLPSSCQPQLALYVSASRVVKLRLFLVILPLDLNLRIDPWPIVATFQNSSLLWTNSTPRLSWAISSRSRNSRHPHRARGAKGGGVG